MWPATSACSTATRSRRGAAPVATIGRMAERWEQEYEKAERDLERAASASPIWWWMWLKLRWPAAVALAFALGWLLSRAGRE